MSAALVIVGCGGFGREVYSLVQAVNAEQDCPWTVTGFIDDSPSAENGAKVGALGSRILGPMSVLIEDPDPPAIVLAIGSPAARADAARRLSGRRMHFPVLVHPAASIGLAVALGEGTVIAAGARLSTQITLGVHVHVDQNATIGHDTTVGHYSRLNPQSCVSGSVQVADRVLIGANATVLPSLRVGEAATIGAQACVVRDVEAGTIVKGVPAR